MYVVIVGVRLWAGKLYVSKRLGLAGQGRCFRCWRLAAARGLPNINERLNRFLPRCWQKFRGGAHIRPELL